MIVYGDFAPKHLHRLHQLRGEVFVIFRTSSLSLDGLNRLDKAARLYRSCKFILVMRRTSMRKAGISRQIAKTRRLKNVYLGVIEDEKDTRNIQRRRSELLERLTRRAREAT